MNEPWIHATFNWPHRHRVCTRRCLLHLTSKVSSQNGVRVPTSCPMLMTSAMGAKTLAWGFRVIQSAIFASAVMYGSWCPSVAMNLLRHTSRPENHTCGSADVSRHELDPSRSRRRRLTKTGGSHSGRCTTYTMPGAGARGRRAAIPLEAPLLPPAAALRHVVFATTSMLVHA